MDLNGDVSFLPPQVAAEAERLVRAVSVALSPNATAEERNAAYTLCERFKEERFVCSSNNPHNNSHVFYRF